MNKIKGLLVAGLLVAASWVAGCASGQPTDSVSAAYAAATSADPTAAAAARSANGKKPVWTIPTEAEVAASLEKKYLEAVKDFVKLKKNDELMFCKRWREIGTSIAKINCLTAAQVRTQVDNMDQYRDDMRNRSGKCTLGAGVGNAPCSAGP
jgi:predicted house-cleaning noncanonical NTP pyrophosphatase (MazG superfamily)